MKTGLIILSLLVAFALQAPAQQNAGPKTEDQKVLYTIGIWLGQQATPFNLTASEMKYVQQGINDYVQGKKPVVDTEVYGPKLNDFAKTRMGARAEQEKKKSASFLAQAAQEKGATKTSSGLIYIPLKTGDGATPKATDKVRVHYEGRLINGTVFDSSIARGSPAEFNLDQVIPCWTEGLQKMKIGGKAKLVCPSNLAYGDRGMPPRIPGGSSLVFQVELLGIVK